MFNISMFFINSEFPKEVSYLFVSPERRKRGRTKRIAVLRIPESNDKTIYILYYFFEKICSHRANNK